MFAKEALNYGCQGRNGVRPTVVSSVVYSRGRRSQTSIPLLTTVGLPPFLLKLLVGASEADREAALYRSHPQCNCQMGPVRRGKNWLEWVNQPQTEAELTALRESVVRGLPFGSVDSQNKTAKQLGLESSLRPRGRPRKTAKK